MKSRFKAFYEQELKPELAKNMGYKNIMEVPKIQKITVNMGLGEAVTDKNVINKAIEELALITGQKAITTRARKSIAGFKIRKGWPIGCKVTLRRDRMYNFLERLIKVAIPRIRDFRGFSSKGFDNKGNYNFGIKEQIVFPEIEYDKVDKIRGMDISITTTAKTNEEAKALLKGFNFPIKDRGE